MNAEPKALLKKTPLAAEHEKLAARFTEFGGWFMPLFYTSVSEEHVAVRESAGLFDVSHMGEITVSGPRALEFLQWVNSNDISVLQPGRALYSLLLNEQGGVVDDIIVYQLAAERYLLCVNAGNTEKDWNWLNEKNRFGAILENQSSGYAQLALQGPNASAILSAYLEDVTKERLEQLIPTFHCKEFRLAKLKHPALLARTGYTGEDGYEIFIAPEDAPELWRTLLRIGSPLGLKPIGLAARDTLRLEACYPLHGHEITDTTSALEAGLGWVVKFEKGNFIGREALLTQKAQGLKNSLVGLEVRERGIVREGTELFSSDSQKVGTVTSGTQTPFLKKSVALAYVKKEFALLGTELLADVRGKKLRVSVCKKPFYKRH